MADQESMFRRWGHYQPSKALWMWSCVGCIILTMILGFTWGGWVTGGSANEMAEDAAQEARANVLATLCVNRFVTAENAADELVELKEASRWDRDEIIQEGGWANIEGLEEGVDAAVDLCAERLAEMEALPARTVVDTGSSAG
jgi:hypothetical protein